MDWYWSTIVSVFTVAGQTLCMQRLQKGYPIVVYMAYVWLAAGAFIGVLGVALGGGLTLSTMGVLVLGGLASWAGMYCYNLAMRDQVNLGYVEAAASTRAVSSYLVSLSLLGAVVEPVRLAAVIGVIVGVVLVANSQRSSGSPGGRTWALWAAVAGIMFCGVATFTRLAIDAGTDTLLATAVVMLVAGVFYAVSTGVHRLEWRSASRVPVMWATIIFAIVGNIAAVMSFATAPNLAYPLAINSSRIVLLYLVAVFAGGEEWQPVRLFGMGLTFVSVAIFSLG